MYALASSVNKKPAEAGFEVVQIIIYLKLTLAEVIATLPK